MSRIQTTSLSRVRLRFREPVRYGGSMVTTQEIGILRIVTDDGFAGLGEVGGPSLTADVDATLERLSRQLVGADPAAVDAVDAGVLTGALDAALLDALGRQQRCSIADLLGGGAASIRVNGLMTAGEDPRQAAATGRELVEAGYQAIKIKCELGADPISVHASLAAVRDAVGLGIALRLDVNGDLTERTAIEWLTTLGALDLDYVEQPIAPSLGVAALARVRAAIPMPLAADESVTDAASARALLDAGAADVLVVKPSRVGGPRRSAHIVRMAAAAGVAVTISTLYDSGIGLAVALHVAATVTGDRAHGLGTASLLESDLIDGGLPIVDGRMVVPIGAGLGVTLDTRAPTD